MLLLRAEVEDFVDHGGERSARREGAMATQRIEEARFAEFFVFVVEGFGDAVGVEGQEVAGGEMAFANFAIPLFENAQDCGGGVKADSVVTAEKKSREMAAVGVAQKAGGVIIFGEEKSGEGSVGGVFAEELVDGAQEMVGLLVGHGAEAAQIGLQVGHQKGSGNAFPGNVRDDKTETILAEIEEVVVVAADLAGLDADAGVFQSGERRKCLRE